ncbi:MAG: OmpH family outer membrane protein [Bacteroidia bacterium]
MKKLVSVLMLSVICFSTGAFAQKWCYVDTQYILDNIPEYKSAQQQLDQLSVSWQKDVEAKYAFIDKLYKDFQAEQILLTDEMKRKRENEIIAKEKEAKEFQKQKFGYEGELFKKKQELVKPIQDKIYNAIKKMAAEQSYAAIFDKSSDLIMLYANPKFDKSDEILNAMGYKAGEKGGDGGAGKSGGSSSGGAGSTSPKENPAGGSNSDIKPK